MPHGGRTQLSTIVLAAGEGTRMRSATPKVLHGIAGRPLIEHAVRAAAGLGPDHLAVVIGHGRDQVAEQLAGLAGELDRTITVAVQDRQNGTGHAVACGIEAIPALAAGTVLVTYGDVPLLDTGTLTGLLDEHAAAGNAVTVLTAVVADPTGYGRILRDADGAVSAIVEQGDATEEQRRIPEINSGIYAFDAEVLTAGLARLSPANAQGELYLTDVIGIARADGHRVGAVACADEWLVRGVNDRVQLAALSAEYNRRLVETWMRAGVTVIDPATTWLDAGVRLARDVLIEPGVQLRGRTEVGEGAVIGPDTTLTDVAVGAGASVIRTHGRESRIGAGASVGPFAYLRPGVELGERGKIGTFVEVKNSEIGTGSKVPHLSYVGDATIGEHTNIGAASVFVNYDGVAKHRSVVGSYARTGSDNMFVAPVNVGDGAYTGAGAVIRRNVPPGALAVSGGPQRIFDRWVLKHRQGTPSAEAAQRALDAVERHNDEREADRDGEG
ncbi:MAG TPA: bifunctional UDP-N-acetylglucosamine diphosphorylase/glucosamine-1-phosphate N-acetyltransferase GlmU [Actinophytocola sp.]|uniref:bifunctional UDP-N-acetylglucosamine diphosphorylase/glucosamine-1-phosphate N-acetyltransferase GlmU n=1 Tax=Actinophytocola sp. TaxID=1872138 RepID=UPI002DC01142|nr:bifunctional UDP-N-acetylglucosamine diphosphorylase/glucosamine-1-phosphate N-acetyltransferase GlmU [Actinophytocola sp.]HEU5475778.1 bifunctional UDP-N-acetylglucosamine diphosphorylase/glucosamine-1-phosphate N-acetyltransferase GlmU [Actinophytocola sp.]